MYPRVMSAIWCRHRRIYKRCLRDDGPPSPRPPAAQEGGRKRPPGQGESRSISLSSRRQNVGWSVINCLNAELGPATSGTAKRVGEGLLSPRWRPLRREFCLLVSLNLQSGSSRRYNSRWASGVFLIFFDRQPRTPIFNAVGPLFRLSLGIAVGKAMSFAQTILAYMHHRAFVSPATSATVERVAK